MESKKPVFTDEELAVRLMDKEAIKDLMSRHCYFLAGDARRKELNDLWVTKKVNRDTAILGYNNGYYTGMDNIAQHYVVDAAQLRKEQLALYAQADPSIKADESNLGLGFMAMHTMNTPLVEIAYDGKTAKFVGYDCGLYCVGKPDGDSDSFFTFGRMYADLACEDGQWKIWHLLITYDHIIPAGHEYSEIPPAAPWGNDLVEQAAGQPTIPDVVYDAFYGWTDMWERLPRPYYTYDPAVSYSPEGKPSCYKIGLYK